MDDAQVVAAIAAGELDGLAAALDKYAASLYEYCYSMAPEVAVDAVRDTFIIAWSRLGELRDPGKLQPWLQAVAGNECFRRMLTEGEVRPDVLPAASLAPELPGRVLSACADNTPAGRAHRVSITHRAGPFGNDGFPKANHRPGSWRGQWRGHLRGHRRAGAAVAAAVVLAATGAAIVAIMPAGNPQHVKASAGGPGRQASEVPSASGAGFPTTPAQLIPAPGRRASSPARPKRTMQAAGKQAGMPEVSPPVVPMATVRPLTSPPAPPAPPAASAAQGVLAVDQAKLTIVSIRGRTSTRTFVLTAEGGPVTGYTIAVPPGLPGSVTVSPSSGSLAAGASATITVTAATTVPFVTSLNVYPGGNVITVVVKTNP